MADIAAALNSLGNTSAPQPVNIGQALAQAGNDTSSSMPQVAPATRGDAFAMGLGDFGVGAGQLMEHVATTPLNAARYGIRLGLNAVGKPEWATLFDPVSSDQFDQIVSQRENQYQAARQAAQQTGIDWWRIGGNVANPLNYSGLGFDAIAGRTGIGAAETALGRIGQAGAQGAILASTQPTTNAPGSFWWYKVKNAALGFAGGTGASAALEGVATAARAAVAGALQHFKGAAASPSVANAIINDSVKGIGANPNAVDLNMLSGLRQDVQDALATGVPTDATSIANRAMAESLPVPMALTKGMASRNPMLWQNEFNVKGIAGVGEPLQARLEQLNSAAIGNLDAIGAKDAPSVAATGNNLAQKMQGQWDALTARKNALYDAVRNSDGQSAKIDQYAVAKNIQDALDVKETSHSYDLLPDNIKRTIDDMIDGSSDMNIAQTQSLDKQWGIAQRGTSDGSIAHVIGQARNILNNAPVSDDLGAEAQQAYQFARQAHAQQMSLVEPKLPNGMPNPQFQPLMKAVVYDGKPPESLLQTHFFGAAPSVAAKNMQFAQQIDPTMPEQIGRTFMGQVKADVLNLRADNIAAVSESKLKNWAADPIVDTILPEPAAATLKNLSKTVSNMNVAPIGAVPNRSGTGAALMNAAGSVAKKFVGVPFKNLPVIHQLAEGLNQAAAQTKVQNALTPGVTLKSILTATPSQAAKNRILAQPLTAAAVAGNQSLNGSNNQVLNQ